MKPVETTQVRKILERRGCVRTNAKGSHEKWTTPGGLASTIVSSEHQQSPGLLRNVQRTFESEFGPRWLEEEFGR